MDKKTTGIVAYLTWIGLVIAFVAGDKEGAKFHLNQALVVNLFAIVLNIASRMVGWIPLLGWIALVIIGLMNFVAFVLWVMGLIYAVQEQEKPLPLIGNIQLLQ